MLIRKTLLIGLLLPLMSCVAGNKDTAIVGCDSALTDSGNQVNVWGYTPDNRRFQADTSISPDNVGALELAWVHNLGEGLSPHAWPLVTDSLVVVGHYDGSVVALDKATGCQHWRHESGGDVRTAIVSDGEGRAFFGGFGGVLNALDLNTGEVLWQVEPDSHIGAMITGSPAYHDGVLYVPVSSMEMYIAVMPLYWCCTFRGSVVAIDAASGEVLWRRHTIEEKPKRTGFHWLVIPDYGPSGAPVWSSPTIDPQRGLVYFGTGSNYSAPVTKTSDSIFALDMKTGERRWVTQLTNNDVWNVACEMAISTNCPEEDGPDFDFGAAPLLIKTPQGDRLFAGQKSGMVYSLNPENGEVLWQRRAGRGGKLGGIHWGIAADARWQQLYVPISDRDGGWIRNHSMEGPPQEGLFALSLEDGSERWHNGHEGACDDATGPCFSGISAAPSASRGLVWSGGLDGRLRAYDAADGRILWQFDTRGPHRAVNGQAMGGSIDVHGPKIDGDMLFVSSGYEQFEQIGGNAFMAFKLKVQ